VNNRQALITLCLAGFAGNVGFSLLFPVLPYYAQGMGASLSQVGLILASYSYVTAIALIPFGMLSDKVGHHRMLIAGLALYTLVPLLYPWASNLSQLGFVRAFHGFACAVFSPASIALALDTSNQDHWGEALGWFTTATQFALVVGPVLGGLLLSHYGFEAAFYSCSIIPLLGLIFVLFKLTTIQPTSTQEVLSTSSWSWLKQPKVFAGLATPLFFTIGSGTILTFMPLYSQSLGINEVGAGIIIATVYIGSALLRVPGGKLSDKIGRKPVILLGLLISFAALILISFLDSFSGLIAAAISYGVGMGIAIPASYTLVADLTPPKLRGLTMGITSSFLHGGLALGPTIMGVVATMSNYTTMFRTCSLSLILGLIVVLGLTRKQH
jgi:Arabinose efflux permease